MLGRERLAFWREGVGAEANGGVENARSRQLANQAGRLKVQAGSTIKIFAVWAFVCHRPACNVRPGRGKAGRPSEKCRSDASQRGGRWVPPSLPGRAWDPGANAS